MIYIVKGFNINEAEVDPQSGEQLYQRIPRKFDFGGQWDLITELPQDWGNRLLEGTDKTLCASGSRRMEQ